MVIECRWCGCEITRPDLVPEPNIHGSCYIEEGKHQDNPETTEQKEDDPSEQHEIPSRATY